MGNKQSKANDSTKNESKKTKETTKVKKESPEKVANVSSEKVTETTTAPASSTNSNNEITVPNHLHRYIIGTKGSTIKEIREKTGSNIDLEGDLVKVSGGDEAKCIELIKETIKPHLDKIDLENAKSLTFTIPTQGTQHVVGAGGSTIKDLQKSYKCKIELDDTKVTIKAATTEACEKAKRAVMDELASHGWFLVKGSWTEKLPYEEEFAAVRKEISDMSDKIHQLGDNSQKAFKSGDGAKAKELSTEMKELVKKRDDLNNKMHEDIFTFLNKDRPSDEIDLHGLHVDFALEKVKQTLENHKNKTVKLIVGAGNHSDKGGAKIKPRVISYLKEQKLSYQQINNGTLQVN